MICLSLFLFNCDTDEVIEESALEERQEDITPNISIKVTDFTEISTNNKVLEKIAYIKERNDKYNMLSRDIHNEEYEFSFNTDYIKYIEYGDYHSYSFPLTRDELENDNLENLFLSLNNDGEYDAFIVKYDFTSGELIDLTEEELNNRTTQYIPIDFDVSSLNLAARFICLDTWILVPSNEGNNEGCPEGECIHYEWVMTWNCYWVAGSGTGSAPGTGDNTSSGGDTTAGGDGSTSSGNDGDPYYYITTPTVIPMSQKLTIYLGPLTPEQEAWADGLLGIRKAQELLDYLLHCGLTAEGRDCVVDTDFALLALDALMVNEFENLNEILYNRTRLNGSETGDIDNNTIGGEDTTLYNDFNPAQQPWPTINPVIPISNFVGWGQQGIIENCMNYAKEQIAKNGYEISNYFDPQGNPWDQTIQIYTSLNGVNQTELLLGLSYLKYALENGIPVIVGIDDQIGSPNPDTDNTTDHFVVIVGMGSDARGKYFTFYDNASGKTPYQNFGANPNNKLYYNTTTGIISGVSNTRYFTYEAEYNYILSQIRKSK